MIKFTRREQGCYESSNGYIIQGNGGTDMFGHPLKADVWYIYTTDSFVTVKKYVYGTAYYEHDGKCVGMASTLREAKEMILNGKLHF